MKMVKVIFSGLLVVGFLMNVSVAQVDTVRVATVEDQQRKEAIMSAQTANAEQDNASFQVVITEEPNTQNQAPTQLEQNVSQSLRPVTLEEEIQQQRVQSKLELFGYEMFNSVATTFAPVSDMPVPYDYVIGPGDTFTIQAFAATNVQYNLTVTREGMLLIPDAGAVNLSGLTFEEAKVVISEAIETRRIGIKTIVTLSEFRSIQIMLVGEVSKPGSYSVSGFSTLINALVSSGGVKRTGSLRNIQVKRHGSVVATFDLYALLLKGDDSANIYLRQGDLIFVPPVGPTVGIAGEILRPAIYELANEQNVSEILSLAGGLLPTANAKNAQIERVSNSGMYTLM
ncbi:MAG: polysaccharide biosynthesis/export family protein, partial [Pseudomonadota bacterium]